MESDFLKNLLNVQTSSLHSTRHFWVQLKTNCVCVCVCVLENMCDFFMTNLLDMVKREGVVG